MGATELSRAIVREVEMFVRTEHDMPRSARSTGDR